MYYPDCLRNSADSFFDLQKDLSDKKMDNSKKLLAMIGSAPNGTTIGELTRNLHIHSKSITKKKLNHLLVMELIKHGKWTDLYCRLKEYLSYERKNNHYYCSNTYHFR